MGHSPGLQLSSCPQKKKPQVQSVLFIFGSVFKVPVFFPSVVKGEHSKGGHLPWSFADTEDVSEDVASAAEALARLDLCPVAEPEPSPADPVEQYAAVR